MKKRNRKWYYRGLRDSEGAELQVELQPDIVRPRCVVQALDSEALSELERYHARKNPRGTLNQTIRQLIAGAGR